MEEELDAQVVPAFGYPRPVPWMLLNNVTFVVEQEIGGSVSRDRRVKDILEGNRGDCRQSAQYGRARTESS